MVYPDVRAGQRITDALLRAMLPRIVVKQADESRNTTTTLTNDNALAVEVDANLTYEFDALLLYATPDAADLKVDMNAPSGTMRWTPRGLGNAVTANIGDLLVQSRTESESAILGGGGGSTVGAHISGTLIVGATGGLLRVRWAQNTSNATNTIMRAYSRLSVQASG